ncbi:MAG: class I SAM-dependent methyltransferase [Thermoproteota archaeon]
MQKVDKAASYYKYTRREMLPFIPDQVSQVLDVGCGVGNFGRLLKEVRGLNVEGVEIVPEIACEAAKVLDKVYIGPFSHELQIRGLYDCIVFNDVLEHMTSPDEALHYAATLLKSNGFVVASIPNIGHFPKLWKILINGRWDYKEKGTLDRDHLRFFTYRSIKELFENLGYKIIRIEGINKFAVNEPSEHKLWRYYK